MSERDARPYLATWVNHICPRHGSMVIVHWAKVVVRMGGDKDGRLHIPERARDKICTGRRANRAWKRR